MAKPPKDNDTDKICPMCKRPKNVHSQEELLSCSHKMKEFQTKDGGAGIQ